MTNDSSTHQCTTAVGLLPSLSEKLYVVERWFAQYPLNTNLNANSIQVKFQIKQPPARPDLGRHLS